MDRCFGGLRPLGTAARLSHHLDVLHNDFTGLREEAVQIGSEAYEVEIAHNRFLGGAQALGLRGTAQTTQIGSVFVHHNTLHSRPTFMTRRTPAGVPVSHVTRAPIVGQGTPNVRVSAPAQMHQVLNNVLYVIGNSTISYGATCRESGS